MAQSLKLCPDKQTNRQKSDFRFFPGAVCPVFWSQLYFDSTKSYFGGVIQNQLDLSTNNVSKNIVILFYNIKCKKKLGQYKSERKNSCVFLISL